MSITVSLGILFLVLAIVTAFLMFHFWGYPYDDVNKRSSCPQWKMNIHRGFGYSYILVYLVMMWHMVPRLWTYQVEFPARTVAHICIAIIIGAILLIKVSIIRWFRHLEELMPALGICLLVCTCLLTGLSLPFAFKEQFTSGQAFTEETKDRLLRVLPDVGIAESEEDAAALASSAKLLKGRHVLLRKCTRCHDLRTVLGRPRTPKDWLQTVTRMARKPSLGQVIDEQEQRWVTTYLVAITPELQESAKELRRVALERENTMDALAETSDEAALPDPSKGPQAMQLRLTEAATTFQRLCSQCHPASQVEGAPPGSGDEVDSLLERMVRNGLRASEAEMSSLRLYLNSTFAE